MSFKQFIPCRKCKATKNIPEGFYRDVETKNGIEYKIIKECLHHVAWQLNENAYKEFIKSGFNKDYFEINNTEDGGDYVGKKSIGNIFRLRNYIEFFNDSKVNSSILYFVGTNGTQKTTTATWIANKLIKNNKSVKYILMKDLLEKLWQENREEDIREYIVELSKCDLLIIDECFDKSKMHIWESGKQIGYLDNFIRNRININKGIIFISNKYPNQIKSEGFSESLQELIKRELLKRDSLFTFEDNYYDEIGAIPERLF